MLRFIEKSFLKITQVVGLLFAIIVLVTAITIGYNKINIKVDKVEVPRIKLADYQKIMRTQEIKIGKNLDSNQYFNQEFDTYIDDIVSSLGSLPDSVISKTDLRQKVKISTRDKLQRSPDSKIS
jgi:preprotein translocase subunit SecF